MKPDSLFTDGPLRKAAYAGWYAAEGDIVAAESARRAAIRQSLKERLPPPKWIDELRSILPSYAKLVDGGPGFYLSIRTGYDLDIPIGWRTPVDIGSAMDPPGVFLAKCMMQAFVMAEARRP